MTSCGINIFMITTTWPAVVSHFLSAPIPIAIIEMRSNLLVTGSCWTCHIGSAMTLRISSGEVVNSELEKCYRQNICLKRKGMTERTQY